MEQNTSSLIRSFNDYINETTRNFVGREWVFKAVNDWLADSQGSRILLLEGKPGCGKTAIASRLVQFSRGDVPASVDLPHCVLHFLSALHFCSTTRDSRWYIPSYLIESLATQLAARYPVYAETLIESSRERQVSLTVQQSVLIGSAQGIAIGQLNIGATPPEDAFHRYIREPLEALYSGGFRQQIIILVDALDEALNYSSDFTIVSLLSYAKELPPNVRFILTSRHDERVEVAFRGADQYRLSSTQFDQLNQDDIQRYVRERFEHEQALTEQIVALESRQIIDITRTITEKAEGNFLYMSFLLDAIANGHRALHNLEGLPEGLEGLYADSLKRVIQTRKRDWATDYAPLIQILSVAQENLTLAQLQAFSGQAERLVLEHRRNLQQFIEEVKVLGEGESRYRLYHQSFVDFLHCADLIVGGQKEENYFYLPAVEAHQEMASGCERDGLEGIWRDEKYNRVMQGRKIYARKHYITHLYNAGVAAWPRLFEVLTAGAYGRAKIHRYDPSTRAYIQDLDLGRQAATWPGWDMDDGLALLPDLWRYTLLRCSLISRADQYPPEAFRLLMLLRHKPEKLLGLAEMITRPQAKVEAFLQIAELMTDEVERVRILRGVREMISALDDQQELETGLQSLGRALACVEQWKEISDSIEDAYQRDCLLSALCEQLAQAKEWDRAEQAIATIQYQKWYARAAYVLVREQAAASLWERATKICVAIQGRKRRNRALYGLAESLTLAHEEEQAEQIWSRTERSITKSKLEPKMQIAELGQLGEAMVCANLPERARQVWGQAESLLDKIKSKQERQVVLCELLIQEQQWERLEEVSVHIYRKDIRVRLQSAQRKALIKNQQWELYMHVIDVMKKYKIKNKVRQAYLELVEALAQAKQWEQVGTVVDSLRENLSLYTEVLFVLGREQIKARQWQAAKETIECIDDEALYEEALYILGREQAEAGQWQESQKTIDSIEDRGLQIKALCKLGLELAVAGEEKGALAVWEKVETLIGTFQERHAQNRALSLLQFDSAQNSASKAVEQNEVGQNLFGQTSFEVLSQIELIRREIGVIYRSDLKARIFWTLGLALAQAQHWVQAQEVIGSIQESEKRIEALLELGAAMVQAGNVEQGRIVWREAQEALQHIPDEIMQARLASELAIVLAEAQQWQQAQEIIITIQGKQERVKALSKLAAALSQVQQWEEAEIFWEETHTIMHSMQGEEKEQALCTLVRGLAQAQEWELAEIELKAIRRKYLRAVALSKLGEMLLLGQQERRARHAWLQTEQLIAGMQAGGNRDQALRALSSAFIHTQQWKDTERIIVAMQSGMLQVRALAELGEALWQAQQRDYAELVWLNAEEVIDLIPTNEMQISALIELGAGLARAQRWEQARHIWREVKEALSISEDLEQLDDGEVEQQSTGLVEEKRLQRRRGRRGGRGRRKVSQQSELEQQSDPVTSDEQTRDSEPEVEEVLNMGEELEQLDDVVFEQQETLPVEEKKRKKQRGRRGGRGRRKTSQQSESGQQSDLANSDEEELGQQSEMLEQNRGEAYEAGS